MNNKIKLVYFNEKALITEIENVFITNGIYRDQGYFERCYEENISGERITVLAFYDGVLAGCSHLKKVSDYPYFKNNNIPEINDLNVFPAFRNKGIAGRIIDELETAISDTYETIGIGVGLFSDYGTAQRLYCKKGYIPDGHGLQYNYEQVQPGTHVFVDDDLNLYYTKQLNDLKR